MYPPRPSLPGQVLLTAEMEQYFITRRSRACILDRFLLISSSCASVAEAKQNLKQTQVDELWDVILGKLIGDVCLVFLPSRQLHHS